MPGTESSESNADKDVQEQLWDDKKVPVERKKNTDTLVSEVAAHGFLFFTGGFIQGQHV